VWSRNVAVRKDFNTHQKRALKRTESTRGCCIYFLPLETGWRYCIVCSCVIFEHMLAKNTILFPHT
jgi:hypothetical protein